MGTAPTTRFSHAAAWTGNSMLLWGGCTVVDGSSILSDGSRFQTFSD